MEKINFNKPTEEKPHPVSPGVQKLWRFDNGYGASVVKFPHSYGYDKGLWELAVIKYSEDDFELTYDTPITDDVIGNLSESDVVKILKKIEKLEGDN